MREILFRETSTIGIRTRHERRDCLERKIIQVRTQWGEVRVKESRLNGIVANFAPEYEDCRRIAEIALQKKTAQEIEEFVIESEAMRFPEGLVQKSV